MKALLLVDLQNDFLPGGALPVTDGDAVIPVANTLLPHFDLVVATQDWHPADHGSFAANHSGKMPGEVIELDGLSQVLWPMHCVQTTPGSDFAAGLQMKHVHHVIRKGTNPLVDSYSGFFDNGQRHATGLEELLKIRGVDEAYILGLATDYCVKFTALDACRLGYKTHLVVDGCRGVGLQPGDVEKAITEMQNAGIILMQSERITGQTTK